MRTRNSIRIKEALSVHLSVGPSAMIELENLKTRISAPVHPSATGIGRISGLVHFFLLCLLLHLFLSFLLSCFFLQEQYYLPSDFFLIRFFRLCWKPHDRFKLLYRYMYLCFWHFCATLVSFVVFLPVL